MSEFNVCWVEMQHGLDSAEGRVKAERALGTMWWTGWSPFLPLERTNRQDDHKELLWSNCKHKMITWSLLSVF